MKEKLLAKPNIVYYYQSFFLFSRTLKIKCPLAKLFVITRMCHFNLGIRYTSQAVAKSGTGTWGGDAGTRGRVPYHSFPRVSTSHVPKHASPAPWPQPTRQLSSSERFDNCQLLQCPRQLLKCPFAKLFVITSFKLFFVLLRSSACL